MKTQAQQSSAREMGIKHYQELGSITKTAGRQGIDCSTFYRWLDRYKTVGNEE